MLQERRCSGLRVSIHAPGRGATQSGQLAGREFEVFQFTHPGGVRRSLSRRL